MKRRSFPINPKFTGPVFAALSLVALVLTVIPPPTVAGLGGPPPAPPRSIPFSDVNPYGANFFLEWEAESWKIERSYQMAQEAGIGWVKQEFPWENIQLKPGEEGYWDDRLNKSTWEKYDQIVNLALKYHLQVIARLDRPPPWSRVDNSDPERPPDNFADYGNFVYDVVRHFKGRIHYYQIWNEPNIYPEWGDQPVDPAAYVRLLKIAYQRAKEADPNVVILSAPLAQTTADDNRNMSDLRYLQEMYRDGAKPYFDVLLANAYGFSLPPTDPPAPNRLNFQRVTLLRNIMVENGDANKAIWFNEFGWNASPADFPANKLTWGRVTEQQQAAYTVEAIQMARRNWPWAGVFNIWYFRQDGHIPPTQSDYYFRMVDPGFTPRPIYNAIRQASRDVGVAPPGTYAITDPAATSSGQWQPILDKDAFGGSVLATSNPGDNLTITFTGSGIDLVIGREDRPATLFITVDGRSANDVPFQAQGRSILDLSNLTANNQPFTTVPIASNLPPGRHVLRLVFGGGPTHPDVRIAGFVVHQINPIAGPYETAGLVARVMGAISGFLTLIGLVVRR